jgi:hypothetical protein
MAQPPNRRVARWSSPGLMLSLSSDGPANPPRPEKSGAKVRFLVDPTIGWRRHEWRFRVDSGGSIAVPRTAGIGASRPFACAMAKVA